MLLRRLNLLLPLLVLLGYSSAAHAYLGPGLGLGAIMTALGVVGAVLLSLMGAIWYPIKRLVRRLRGRTQPPGTLPSDDR
ncbi:MAG TPA: hypothetical protein VF638_12865 [Sphingomonas sp.]|jgi:hypothetical protein